MLALNYVKKNLRAGGFAQAVLAYLADCMNEADGKCFPSRETIAEYFSSEDDPCTVKRVDRALARLRELGFIKSECVPHRKQPAKGIEGGWHNEYSFPGLSGGAPKTDATHRNGVDPIAGVSPTVERGSPQIGQGVAPTVERGSPHRGVEKQKETEENQKEPVSSMRTSGKTSAIAVASAQAQTPYPDDFDKSLFEEAEREARSFPEPLPEPPALPPIEPPAPAPQKRKAAPRRRPATPCPFDADASIPDEYKAIAEKVGIGNPQQVFSAFVNHALAHDRRLVIWPAGFRTWCSNELRYHPNQTPKPKPLHQRTAADYDW